MFWTFQTKAEQSKKKHIPFITWPVQDECITLLIRSIRDGGDLLVDKSREMGATWLILGCFFAEWLLVDYSTLMVISRKEEYVWKKGNPDTLFWKLRYILNHLPAWIKPKIREGFELTERHLANPENGSVIDGESTNADVGAGGRRQAIMCDEFSRVKAPDAASIADTLSDTTPARIFNSTPTSRGHPFGQIRFSGKVKVFTMPWWRHPWKNRGLYISTDIDSITILDLKYYKEIAPRVFASITEGVPFKYSAFENDAFLKYPDNKELRKITFLADGNDPANREMYSPTGRRSPWYDRECRRRSLRDKATNIDIDYVGAGDVVFDPMILARMIEAEGREPEILGEIEYQLSKENMSQVRLVTNKGRNRFKWWGELAGSRPPQNHNFIMGCDISLGAGQSNSVVSIYDCNLNSKVGSWVCAMTGPVGFAEQTAAIGRWVGGATKIPFLIWEANGPGGVFNRRLFELGYNFVYYTRQDKLTSRKRQKTRGWYSTGDNKLSLLIEYDSAMAARFTDDTENKAFKNPDIVSLREAEDYIFFGRGKVIGPAASEGDESGAKSAHGDRVIADALCCLARYDQPRAAMQEAPSIVYGSFAMRRDIARRELRASKNSSKWLF